MILIQTLVTDSYLKLWIPNPYLKPLVLNVPNVDQLGTSDRSKLAVGWLTKRTIEELISKGELLITPRNLQCN